MNKIFAENKKHYDFIRALYGLYCPKCGTRLEWVAEFDLDDEANYNTYCCNRHFHMFPSTVVVEIGE